MTDRETGSGSTRYRVGVLGPLIVERDGVPLDTARWQHRVQTLFKLLVTSPGRQRRRDDLIDVLWPDADPDAASGNLRIVVHRLRLALDSDPSAVLSANGWVTLNPAYDWVLDLEEMEELACSARGDLGRLEKAVSLMRGEPLVEDRYDDWAAPLIERARHTWRDACLQLAAIFTARGHHEEAASWYRQVLDADPLDEEAVRGLVSAMGRAGQAADALRTYERFRQVLANDLDAEPAPETEVLIERLRSQATDEGERALPRGSFLGAEPDSPLVGRADEVERALLAADATEAGAGRLVMVTGEVGAGKTRLAQEVMLRVRDRAFVAAAARCYLRDRAVPFAVFLDLMSQVESTLPPSMRDEARARWPLLTLLLPHGRQAPAPEDPDDQHALFRECAAFLGWAAERRPLALLLDDLQYADEGTLDLIAYLAREIRGHSVYVLACYRDGDISREHPLAATVRDMMREGVVERIALNRFTLEETGELIAALLRAGQIPGEFPEFVFRRTRGNPLFVGKMIRSLGGRYRLLRQVGAGGMGRVFEAVDDRTGQRVAVKLMFGRTEADPKEVLRFQQEGAVLAGLRHPNIVQVHGTFVEEYASCIAMEMLDGQPLSALLENGPLPLGRAKKLATQILSALAAAHERGVVHRDIKPANVMVLDDDHAVVTDFGVAHLARHGTDTSLTSTGLTLGTPLYMAPEQIQAGRVDARTDLYAVGALLYHMVTGRPPFHADDSLAVAFMHVNDAPVPVRARRPGAGEEWDAVTLRALAKSPDDRYQSAVAMARTLSSLPVNEREPARHPSTQAPSLPHQEPSPGGPGATRSVATLLGLAAVALIAAVWILPHIFRSSPAISASLRGPDAVAVDSRGDVYVTDRGNDRVVEFNPAGRLINAWGTQGGGSLQFSNPGDLALAPDGNLYVVDNANRRIEVLWGGRQVAGDQVDAGSLTFDRSGHLFASDFGDYRIWEYARGWRLIRILPAPEIRVGAQPFSAGMATDRQGNLYVADRLNDRIVKLAASGHVLAAYGRYGSGMLSAGSVAQFDTPSAVAVDRHGQIYVGDTHNDRVEILSPAGRVLRVLPPPNSGTVLGQVTSVAVDQRGDIYAAEYYDNQLVKLAPNGRVLWVTPGS